MAIKVNIPQLLERVFGLRGVVTRVEGSTSSAISLNGIDTIDINPETATSILGTPIYEVVKLKTPDGSSYNLPDASLIDASQAKIIIKTQIQGRPGRVKEFISLDDFSIEIRGLIISQNDNYPLDEVRKLSEIFKINSELQVEALVLNMLGIHNIVIEDIKWPRLEATPSVQPFTISASSDTPIELQLK
jgi:hypothetical protein